MALFYYLDVFRKNLEPCPWSFPEPVSCSHPPSTSFSGLSLQDVPAILGFRNQLMLFCELNLLPNNHELPSSSGSFHEVGAAVHCPVNVHLQPPTPAPLWASILTVTMWLWRA